MSEIKLLPCPFCGGEAEMNYSVFSKCEAYARCKCCGARTMEFSSASLQDARLKAIQSWNTRKPMQEIVERLEEDCKIHRKDKEEAYLTDDFKLYQSYSDVNDGLESAIRIVKEVGGMNE